MPLSEWNEESLSVTHKGSFFAGSIRILLTFVSTLRYAMVPLLFYPILLPPLTWLQDGYLL